jgi:hypothetical protein
MNVLDHQEQYRRLYALTAAPAGPPSAQGASAAVPAERANP